MTWHSDQFRQHPKLGAGQVDALTLPGNEERLLIDGQVTATGAQIINSDLSGVVDLTTVQASLGICSYVNCVACPSGTGGTDCMNFEVQDATWNNMGSGPLIEVN